MSALLRNRIGAELTTHSGIAYHTQLLSPQKKPPHHAKDLHSVLQNALSKTTDIAYRARMTSEMLESIRQSGAKARVAGLRQQENPFYAIAALPWATGDTTAEWQVKASAWTEGWTGTITR